MDIIFAPSGTPHRGSTKSTPPDLRTGIWVCGFCFNRIRERISDRQKHPFVSQACRELVAQGGIIAVIGGNLHALEQANAQSKKRWQRFSTRARRLKPEPRNENGGPYL